MSSSNKKWKCPLSIDFVLADESEVSIIFQVYAIGIYCIIDGDPARQYNLTPGQAQNRWRKIKKALGKDVTKLEHSAERTVEEINGFYMLSQL